MGAARLEDVREAVSRVLRVLFDAAYGEGAPQPPEQFASTYANNADFFDRVLRGQAKSSRESPRFMPLPPLPSGAVSAVLSLVVPSDNRDGDLTYLLCLVPRNSDEPRDSHHPRRMGYRFETPHSVDGDHNYYHVQPTPRIFQRDGLVGDGMPGFPPDDVPAIPLKARCPMTALLAVLVSLYGIPSTHRYLQGAKLDPRKARIYVEYLQELAKPSCP